MRSAAASVTNKACLRAIAIEAVLPFARVRISLPVYVGTAPRLRHPVLGVQPGGGGGQRVGGEIDLVLGREASETEPDRGVRQRVRQSERAQHIGRLDRGRGAGRPGGHRDRRAGGDQLGRGQAGEGQVQVAGQPVLGVAVDPQPRNPARQASLQPVAQARAAAPPPRPSPRAAIAAARPRPTQSGVGKVPERKPRSWPPPSNSGSRRTRGRRLT